MGFTRVPTIYTLENVDGNEGFIVRMKGLKIKRLRELIVLLESDDSELDAMIDDFVAVLVEGIVSWNLEEEDGTPVPADAEGISSLEMGTLMGLVSEWVGAITGVGEELGKGSPSGEQFPGQPVTMEAL